LFLIFQKIIKISLKSDYQERLKNTIILNEDYKKVIKKYDSENSLIYLDPPYEESDKSHYDNPIIDYNELLDILSNIKGKFILSINNSKKIRDLFQNFKIKKIKTKYTNPLTGGQSKKITELLITNYEK